MQDNKRPEKAINANAKPKVSDKKQQELMKMKDMLESFEWIPSQSGLPINLNVYKRGYEKAKEIVQAVGHLKNIERESKYIGSRYPKPEIKFEFQINSLKENDYADILEAARHYLKKGVVTKARTCYKALVLGVYKQYIEKKIKTGGINNYNGWPHAMINEPDKQKNMPPHALIEAAVVLRGKGTIEEIAWRYGLHWIEYDIEKHDTNKNMHYSEEEKNKRKRERIEVFLSVYTKYMLETRAIFDDEKLKLYIDIVTTAIIDPHIKGSGWVKLCSILDVASKYQELVENFENAAYYKRLANLYNIEGIEQRRIELDRIRGQKDSADSEEVIYELERLEKLYGRAINEPTFIDDLVWLFKHVIKAKKEDILVDEIVPKGLDLFIDFHKEFLDEKSIHAIAEGIVDEYIKNRDEIVKKDMPTLIKSMGVKSTNL